MSKKTRYPPRHAPPGAAATPLQAPGQAPTCASCWWFHLPSDAVGICFRYPPQMIPGGGPAGLRPVLALTTRACGEYAAAEERKAAA